MPVFTDIYPDAIKIGMVSSSALIETIAKKLRQYDAKHIVVDPVMVATSGSKLLQDSAIQILTGQLLPMAEVVTPQHSGGRDPVRHDHHRCRRDGGRCKVYQRKIRLCRALQGRPQGE